MRSRSAACAPASDLRSNSRCWHWPESPRPSCIFIKLPPDHMATTTVLIVLLLVTMALLAVGAWVLARKLRRLRSMVRRQERHVWETHNVFRVLEGAAPLPLPGGWAASTDLLGELMRAIAVRRPQCVVELGSGVSTLVIAAALRANG